MMTVLRQMAAGKLGTADDLHIPSTDVSTLAPLLGFLNTVYYIAGAIAVIVLIIAGINYITSGGDANKLTTAKNTIVYTVVGLLFIITAFAITNFMIARVQ